MPLDGILNTLEKNYFNKGDWDQLGLRLGLLYPTLKSIKAAYNNDPAKCLTDMLSHWLNRTDHVDTKGGPTLNTLALTLKDMGYTAAYDNIKQKVSMVLKITMCYQYTIIS